jgi:hypothetical protein
MASLGSFGAAVREIEPDGERDTFELFGETFTVEAAVPSVVLMKFCAGLVGQLSGIETDATMYELLRHALTKPPAKEGAKPDASQWERFYELAASRKCKSDDLITLVLAIAGAQAGKEHGQSPTSEGGSQSVGTSSNGSALDSPDSGGLIPVDQLLGG